MLYSFLKNNSAATRVQFYSWDSENSKYVQYLNNVMEYTSGTANSKIVGNKITALPSASIAPWLEDEKKKFIGYVCIDENVLNEFKLDGKINYEYPSHMKTKTTYVKTQGDLYSRLYWDSTYSSQMADLMTAAANLQLIELFKFRITVWRNEDTGAGAYYTVDRDGVQILDGVRVNITVELDGEQVTVQKDLKMLNTTTQLAEGRTTYAIPLYEEIGLTISTVNYNSSSREVTLTSNTNMINSTVFELNSNHTIFYNPQDVRVVVLNASITVFPVTNIVSGFTPSFIRFALLFFVGAKCKSAITPVIRRFISSGNGKYLSYVRSPAST